MAKHSKNKQTQRAYKIFSFSETGNNRKIAIIRISTIFLPRNAGEKKIEWNPSCTEGYLNTVGI